MGEAGGGGRELEAGEAEPESWRGEGGQGLKGEVARRGDCLGDFLSRGVYFSPPFGVVGGVVEVMAGGVVAG